MNSIPFRIFKIENDPIVLHADAFNQQFDMDFEFQVSYNGSLNDRIIGCKTEYLFKQKDVVISDLTVYCYFLIEAGFVQSETTEGKLVLDKEFLRYLATISVGTARGIQHAKTQGTVLNPFVIPPINLMNIDIQDFTLETLK